MEDQLFNRILTVFQLILAVLLFSSMGIIFVNNAIIHFKDWFISTMFLLMFVLSSWMLRLALKEIKIAFN